MEDESLDDVTTSSLNDSDIIPSSQPFEMIQSNLLNKRNVITENKSETTIEESFDLIDPSKSNECENLIESSSHSDIILPTQSNEDVNKLNKINETNDESESFLENIKKNTTMDDESLIPETQEFVQIIPTQNEHLSYEASHNLFSKDDDLILDLNDENINESNDSIKKELNGNNISNDNVENSENIEDDMPTQIFNYDDDNVSPHKKTTDICQEQINEEKSEEIGILLINEDVNDKKINEIPSKDSSDTEDLNEIIINKNDDLINAQTLLFPQAKLSIDYETSRLKSYTNKKRSINDSEKSINSNDSKNQSIDSDKTKILNDDTKEIDNKKEIVDQNTPNHKKQLSEMTTVKFIRQPNDSIEESVDEGKQDELLNLQTQKIDGKLMKKPKRKIEFEENLDSEPLFSQSSQIYPDSDDDLPPAINCKENVLKLIENIDHENIKKSVAEIREKQMKDLKKLSLKKLNDSIKSSDDSLNELSTTGRTKRITKLTPKMIEHLKQSPMSSNVEKISKLIVKKKETPNVSIKNDKEDIPLKIDRTKRSTKLTKRMMEHLEQSFTINENYFKENNLKSSTPKQEILEKKNNKKIKVPETSMSVLKIDQKQNINKTKETPDVKLKRTRLQRKFPEITTEITKKTLDVETKKPDMKKKKTEEMVKIDEKPTTRSLRKRKQTNEINKDEPVNKKKLNNSSESSKDFEIKISNKRTSKRNIKPTEKLKEENKNLKPKLTISLEMNTSIPKDEIDLIKPQPERLKRTTKPTKKLIEHLEQSFNSTDKKKDISNDKPITSRRITRSNSNLPQTTTISTETKKEIKNTRKGKREIVPSVVDSKKNNKKPKKENLKNQSENDSINSSTRSLRNRTITKIALSNYVPDIDSSKLKKLDAEITTDICDANILVMGPNAHRTFKFLAGICRGIPIVDHLWLEETVKSKYFQDLKMYGFESTEMEREYKFCLATSINISKNKKLLSDYCVIITPSTTLTSDQYKIITQCANGEYVDYKKIINSKNFVGEKKNYLVVTDNDKLDEELCDKIKSKLKKIKLMKEEKFLQAIVQQKI